VLILLVVAGILAWHRFQQPPEFILVTRIARAHPTEREEWVLGGLLQQNIPNSNRTPCLLTLTGWDGRQRWRITTPAATLPERPGDHPSWNERTIAVSPDGRTVALLFTDGPYIRVYGWRDGELASSAKLPRVPGKPAALPLYSFTVTNDGFLWVSTPQLRTCRVWRIDGKHVASGIYPMPFPILLPQETEFRNEISQDGSALLCWEALPLPNPKFSPNGQFHYIAVKVKGAQIVFNHRYTINESYIYPLGNGIVFANGAFYGPDGKIAPNSKKSPIPPQEPNVSYREQYKTLSVKGTDTRFKRTTEVVISRFTKHAWVIPHSKRSRVYTNGFTSTDPGVCTNDGRYALIFLPAVPLKPEGVFAQLKRIPVLHTRLQYREKLAFLSLYERPGKLLARLPLTHTIGVYDTEYYTLQDTTCEIRRWALSPDGRHVGLSLYRNDSEFEYRLYRVK